MNGDPLVEFQRLWNENKQLPITHLEAIHNQHMEIVGPVYNLYITLFSGIRVTLKFSAPLNFEDRKKFLQEHTAENLPYIWYAALKKELDPV